MGRSRGVREERTDHTKLFSRTLAGSGLTWHQEVQFSTFDSKLELRCTRSGSQNPPFCPGSLQNTFIIVPRYLTNIFFKHILQTENIPRIENLEIRKSQNPGSLTGAQPTACFPTLFGLLFGLYLLGPLIRLYPLSLLPLLYANRGHRPI